MKSINPKTKLVLFLLVIPGLLQEVLTGNTPILNLLNPIGFLGLILAYGIPMILIWDMKNRYNLGYYSIFILGLAYGIFNEGLLAKTILESSSIPIGGFKDYFNYGGINVGWTLMILPWHAFYSVLFPICLGENLFYDEKKTMILSRKWTIIWFFMCSVFFVFLAKEWQGIISPYLYVAFYLGIISLGFLAIKLPVKTYVFLLEDNGKSKKFPYFTGVISIFVFVLLFIVVGKVHFVFFTLFALFGCIMISIYFNKLMDKERGRFLLGAYIGFGSFGTLASIVGGRIDLLISYIAILSILHYLIVRKTNF